MASMERKRYSHPTISGIHLTVKKYLLSGSNEVPGGGDQKPPDVNGSDSENSHSKSNRLWDKDLWQD